MSLLHKCLPSYLVPPCPSLVPCATLLTFISWFLPFSIYRLLRQPQLRMSFSPRLVGKLPFTLTPIPFDISPMPLNLAYALWTVGSMRSANSTTSIFYLLSCTTPSPLWSSDYVPLLSPPSENIPLVKMRVPFLKETWASWSPPSTTQSILACPFPRQSAFPLYLDPHFLFSHTTSFYVPMQPPIHISLTPSSCHFFSYSDIRRAVIWLTSTNKAADDEGL